MGGMSTNVIDPQDLILLSTFNCSITRAFTRSSFVLVLAWHRAKFIVLSFLKCRVLVSVCNL